MKSNAVIFAVALAIGGFWRTEDGTILAEAKPIEIDKPAVTVTLASTLLPEERAVFHRFVSSHRPRAAIEGTRLIDADPIQPFEEEEPHLVPAAYFNTLPGGLGQSLNMAFAQPASIQPTNTITAVPEPATWAMMIAGFVLAGAVVRRRRTQVAFSF